MRNAKEKLTFRELRLLVIMEAFLPLVIDLPFTRREFRSPAMIELNYYHTL